MSERKTNSIGFFPNFVSVSIFIFIMIGMFFGFTKVYPKLANRYISKFQETQNNDTKTEERLAPFVRGALAGVKTSEISSMRESGALNITSIIGYKSGVQTALLTSKNWYNLDRQLFRIRGLELGFMTAIQTSRSVQERSTLGYQIKLIQRIQVALNTNLEELLSNNEDKRRVVLENYIQGLKKLIEEANIEIENMNRIITEAKTDLDQGIQTGEQYKDSFVSDSSEFVTDNIDTNLDQYLEAMKQVEAAKIRINTTGEILKKLQPLAKRLDQVRVAIEANISALSTGIKITPTPGVSLPIIQEN